MYLVISKRKFESLNGLELFQEILRDPINQVIGKNIEIKRKVYEKLTFSQKILFSLLLMLAHTKAGWLEFYHGAIFRGGYEQAFPTLKEGSKVIDDLEMLKIVNKCLKLYEENLDLMSLEGFFNEKNLELSEERQIAFKVFKKFLFSNDQLYFSLRINTIRKLEIYIRKNSEDFVNLQDH